jgi:hypothetical protein
MMVQARYGTAALAHVRTSQPQGLHLQVSISRGNCSPGSVVCYKESRSPIQMNTITDKQLRSRRWWRVALLLLVVLSFVPELIIYAVTALAKVRGCSVQGDKVCLIVGVSASDIISFALNADLFVGKEEFSDQCTAVWLALCYLAGTLGWERLTSRLLLAFLVSIIAILRLLMAMLVVPAYKIYSAGWEFILFSWRMPLCAFVIYVIIAIVIRLIAARRVAASQQ